MKKFLLVLTFLFVFSYLYAGCYSEYRECDNLIEKDEYNSVNDFKSVSVYKCEKTFYTVFKYYYGKEPSLSELQREIKQNALALRDTDKDIEGNMAEDSEQCFIFVDSKGMEIYSKRF